MIVEYIRYSIAEDRREAFENAYAEAQTSLQASSHCLGWERTRCSEDLTQYILRIEWDSAEGHMTGFRDCAEIRSFFAAVRPFFDNIQEMRHFEPTTVRGEKVGA